MLSGHDELDSTSSQAEIKQVKLRDDENVDDLVIGIPKVCRTSMHDIGLEKYCSFTLLPYGRIKYGKGLQ